MANRAYDWLRQAHKDLEQAKDSQRDGHHEWACFAAQQAAEKAVKALHLSSGQEFFGHVVAKILRQLPRAIKVPEELVEKAQVLDSYYISSRYPNAYPEGSPFEHYGILQSKQAIDYASEIIEFVNCQMA